ncbi:PIN domain-containing protein [Streptomyces sp. NPDC087440]|uniref:PIN domain-containing protein n=1 Tax=Streptomyces sp. NPDC087440 TaxID=3365790 RepID=UPI0037FFDD3A
MIILDTNILWGLDFDGSDVEVLRAIVATGTDRVAAPETAVEERAAQKALEYLDAHKAAASALHKLQRASHRSEPRLDPPDPEGMREKWRRKFAGILEVLPPSRNALSEGMFREANILPPAGTKSAGGKQVKVGARDVTIWLTAIEYAREHPDETVYFVSNNHKDFTKGDANYPPPMDADVAGLGERFIHLTNLGEVLETVAPHIQVQEADIHGLLEKQTGYITDIARTRWAKEPSDYTRPSWVMTRSGAVEAWRVFFDDAHVRLVDVRDVVGYRLGAQSWYVATARWQFVGMAFTASGIEAGASIWEARILAPAQSGDDHVFRILSSSGFQPAENASSIDGLQMKEDAAYTDRLLSLLEQEEGRKPTWVEVMWSLLRDSPPGAVQRKLAELQQWGSPTRRSPAVEYRYRESPHHALQGNESSADDDV